MGAPSVPVIWVVAISFGMASGMESHSCGFEPRDDSLSRMRTRDRVESFAAGLDAGARSIWDRESGSLIVPWEPLLRSFRPPSGGRRHGCFVSKGNIPLWVAVSRGNALRCSRRVGRPMGEIIVTGRSPTRMNRHPSGSQSGPMDAAAPYRFEVLRSFMK